MKWIPGLLLPLLLWQFLPAEDDLPEVVQKIADVERNLPWFWCPPLEGSLDMPYTYEMKEAKEFLDKRGKQVHPATSIHMERIPLEGGSYYRCLMENGTSPCSNAIVSALEADSRKAANFTAEEKATAAAAGEERRQRRRAFWTDFATAFRFQRIGPTEISFAPTGKYRPRREPNTELLARIKGSFQFDPATFEITRTQYDILADTEILWRLYKGSHVSVTLAQLADHHYLPLRLEIERELPKGGMENSTMEYANYRRFAADSSVQFVDRDKQDEHLLRR